MPDTARASRPFNLLAKPAGPLCNLGCRYCFYLEKEQLFTTAAPRMSDEVLEQYIRQYIAAIDLPEVVFSWQGGEPTLMGLDFFRRAVDLQRRHCPPGRRITNAFQTNGTLLDADWCAFFRDHGFLVGLSVDGPRAIHDRYRVDRGGRPTFDRVLRSLEMLREHGVEFNTLTVVGAHNAGQALEVYEFLREVGSTFHQYIPLVERPGPAGGDFALAGPPTGAVAETAVTPWSVTPAGWGDFLIRIFDTWVRRDVGQVFVQLFEEQLGVWLGRKARLCLYAPTCGDALAIEHNGDVFACDHYVYPEYRLGNLLELDLATLAALPVQQRFGLDKRDTLPAMCRSCDYRSSCHGECPKRRFLRTPTGEPGLNYLCAGYKRFYQHIDPAMTLMARLVRSGQPVRAVMSMLPPAGPERTGGGNGKKAGGASRRGGSGSRR